MWLEAEDYPILLGPCIYFLFFLISFSFLLPTVDHSPISFGRLCGFGGMPSLQFIRTRFANEGGGYVWVWATCLCFGFCLVSHVSYSVLSPNPPALEENYADSLFGFGDSLDELVKDGKNGLIFKDAKQLAEQLEVTICFPLILIPPEYQRLPTQTLLTSFPSSSHLSSLRTSLKMSKHQPSPSYSLHRSIYSLHGEGDGDGDRWEWGTWEENWTRVVKPLITDRTF